jgi:hypothetical protein
MPSHMRLGGDGAMAMPSVDPHVEMAVSNDGQVGVGGGEDRAGFSVQFYQQSSRGRGRQRQVRFLAGRLPLASDNGAIDVEPIAGFEI